MATELFSSESCENFKNTLFYRTPSVAASVNKQTSHFVIMFGFLSMLSSSLSEAHSEFTGTSKTKIFVKIIMDSAKRADNRHNLFMAYILGYRHLLTHFSLKWYFYNPLKH